MIKRMSKRAESTSLSAVIAIIILAVLLVLVVMALSGAFGGLGDYNPFSGGSNIDAVVNGCRTVCSGGVLTSEDAWCRYRPTEVKFAKKDPRNGMYSCAQLATLSGFNDVASLGCNVQCPDSYPKEAKLTNPPAEANKPADDAS